MSLNNWASWASARLSRGQLIYGPFRPTYLSSANQGEREREEKDGKIENEDGDGYSFERNMKSVMRQRGIESVRKRREGTRAKEVGGSSKKSNAGGEITR